MKSLHGKFQEPQRLKNFFYTHSNYLKLSKFIRESCAKKDFFRFVSIFTEDFRTFSPQKDFYRTIFSNFSFLFDSKKVFTTAYSTRCASRDVEE